MYISNIKPYTPYTFKSNNRRVVDKSGRLLYKTTTYFFRNDMDWDRFIDILDSKYKNTKKVNLINHACSNGPEVYSLAMKLITGLGTSSEKFFPILAKDINSDNIEIAKQGGSMGINNEDIYRINYYTKNNINSFLDFRPARKPEHQLAVAPKAILKNKVTFTEGNIIQDVDSLPDKNTVLMCRNFWLYLKDGECKLLANKLGKKFDNTSLIVLGEHDINKSNAPKYLKEAGFTPIETPYIYCSRKTNQQSLSI